MDTTEELYGYFYAGMPNLSAGELFFWSMVDETMKQLGVDDIGAVVAILSGQNIIPTRTKPLGSIPRTSPASILFRRLIDYKLPSGKRLPTLVGLPLINLRMRLTNHLGAFVSRTVPVVGWLILAYDITQIMYKSTIHYNCIAKEPDKLWR